MSLGSLAEIDTLLAAAEDQGYIGAERLAEIETLRSRASGLVFGLQKRMRARVKGSGTSGSPARPCVREPVRP